MFDYADADVVLRSDCLAEDATNHVDFRVHKSILSASSPFFDTMFSLPQSSSTTATLPIIPMTEDHATLDILLRCIYPVPDPQVETLSALVSALEAARKYELITAVGSLCKRLVGPDFLRSDPLRVYAIAIRYKLDEEAKLASTATLSINPLDCEVPKEDLAQMDALSYHRLMVLHKTRARDAVALLDELPPEVKCMVCNGTHYGSLVAPKWWADYRDRAREELRVRPTSEVVFTLPFLGKSANAGGCQMCAASMFSASWYFDELKRRIDALPATI